MKIILTVNGNEKKVEVNTRNTIPRLNMSQNTAKYFDQKLDLDSLIFEYNELAVLKYSLIFENFFVFTNSTKC
jgi:hypothetical protein